MRVELQFAVEGVQNGHDTNAQAVSNTCVSLDDLCGNVGQGPGQVGVIVEQRPKYIRHGERNSLIGNVWQCGVAFPLPLRRGPLPTTATRSRLAGVAENLFLL